MTIYPGGSGAYMVMSAEQPGAQHTAEERAEDAAEDKAERLERRQFANKYRALEKGIEKRKVSSVKNVTSFFEKKFSESKGDMKFGAKIVAASSGLAATAAFVYHGAVAGSLLPVASSLFLPVILTAGITATLGAAATVVGGAFLAHCAPRYFDAKNAVKTGKKFLAKNEAKAPEAPKPMKKPGLGLHL